MEFRLMYGAQFFGFSLDHNNVSILESQNIAGYKDIEISFKESLQNPINSKSLDDIIKSKKKKKTLIIVSDYTRAVPYYNKTYNLLILLINYLNDNGILDGDITLLVAGGIHRFHTEQENKKSYGDEVVERVNILPHDNRDVRYVQTLSTGNELWVNKAVLEADIVILTGRITPHYFAGFSGGRKSILPGVAGRNTIRENHAKIQRVGVRIGELTNNPISEEMSEACNVIAPDFLINFVVNIQKEIVFFACGHHHDAFIEGTKVCRDLYGVQIEKKRDVAILSAGGYPKDVNLLQVQKTLNVGKELVHPGGTIILLAQCQEGIGSDIFEAWLSHENLFDILDTPEHKILLGAQTAINTAKILLNYNVVLISDMNQKLVEKLHFTYACDIEDVVSEVIKKHGANFSCYVVPFGSLIYPYL